MVGLQAMKPLILRVEDRKAEVDNKQGGAQIAPNNSERSRDNTLTYPPRLYTCLIQDREPIPDTNQADGDAVSVYRPPVEGTYPQRLT